MDPTTKQEAKYSTKNLMGYWSDKTAVGKAKIFGDEGAKLDIAVLKATLQDDVVPKEKHVRNLKIACTGSAPRQQVNFVIHSLAKRMEEKPKDWLVTLKTLIVFHRLMAETGDPSFQEELLRYCERTGMHRLLRLDSFADHTTKETWDHSAWIRMYSVYLDERLSLYRHMKFDPVHDQGVETRESKLKGCPAPELLEHLPMAQKLLMKLISCVPEGASQQSEIVLLACAMVLKEVRPIYKLVCEGIINLADKFFEMERGDALKGLEVYKENILMNEKLNAFFAVIQNIPPLRGAVQFPSVQSLPGDFLTTMEEYVRDVPKTMDASGSMRKPGSAPPPAMVRSSSHAARGGTTSAALGGPRLVVGGPVTEPKSGPASPTQSTTPAAEPVAAKKPDLVDLLDFDALSVTPARASTAASGASSPPPPAMAPAHAGGAFDPFNAAAAYGGAHAPQQQQQYAAAPAQTSAFMQSASFAQAAYGGAPQQQQPAAPAPAAGFGGDYAFSAAPAPPPAANGFGDNAFGAPRQVAPAQLHMPPPMPTPAPAPAPFNPFGAPAAPASAPNSAPTSPIPATPAPMPPMYGAPQMGMYGQPPMQPMQASAGYAHVPQNPFAAAPAVQAAANPFGANPFAAPGVAPAPANPFGAAPPAMASPVNPFGAASPWGTTPGGGPMPAAAAPAPYTLKQRDPLMDLSVDLFGKPAPPVNPSLRDMKQAHGSPGTLL